MPPTHTLSVDEARRVYRDRRGDNDNLAVWDDVPPGYDKDPYLHLTRVDDAATGEPIAIVFAFGMHGTLLGEENWMYSTDSTGGVEAVVQDQLDTPAVVMHLQTGGGHLQRAHAPRDRLPAHRRVPGSAPRHPGWRRGLELRPHRVHRG